MDPELDFWGGASDSFHNLFRVRSFTTVLFAIGNIAVWESWSTVPLGSAPDADRTFLLLVLNDLSHWENYKLPNEGH